MKFAKFELVPEWRAKYLDYKTGKKKVKAIARAIQKTHRSPRYPSLRRANTGLDDPAATPSNPFLSSSLRGSDNRRLEIPGSFYNPSTPGGIAATPSRSTTGQRNERQPLRVPGSRFSAVVGSYGSIIPSPPHHGATSDIASLELPDPALDPKDDAFYSPPKDTNRGNRLKAPSPDISRNGSSRKGPLDSHNRSPLAQPSEGGKSSLRNTYAGPSATRTSQLLKRVFSYPDWEQPEKRPQTTTSMSEVERREDEFFGFLDGELAKIESFYQMKENEATQRLQVLREQLHIMRDRRIQEVLSAKKSRSRNIDGHQSNGLVKLNGFSGLRLKETLMGRNRFGKNSEALAQMNTVAATGGQNPDTVMDRRDFMRRPEDAQHGDVTYRSAKRKLKYALQEFYRGLELLKAYAYLNRTAFRKINKKYDKVVHARPTMRYMSEKVNKSWFVQSEVTENLMAATEDLYARYFERGNRKIAISKLRHTINKSGDYSPNTFRAGLLSMAGVLFGIQSLIYAGQHLEHEDDDVQVRTSYLLQIYAGYFLIVFHFLLFCLDCMVWTKSKINYAFVFEYDTRHALDWRQLSELPCVFMFMLGLFMWLNFLTINSIYIYWPVVLIGLTVFILFLPARVLYHRSRKWWAYSNWRLLLAGLYPVEFRDFFLGDMYCSQTYAMGNIELFFCLYAQHWDNAPQCNSSHSRLLGFFQCLPSIWRALQCLRRYADTKNMFPHLLNFGKYMFGVLYYATLSMYRIEKMTRFQAPFVTFALLNAVYTSVWDLIMDWSLGNPYAKHPLLREVLAFRKVWVYYVAMVFDVIIRFNWIYYAIFAADMQHSALLSFIVALSEIFRRGVWTIFRVENEHCTNVLLFRASRDVPLPYEVTTPEAEGEQEGEELQLRRQRTTTPRSAPADVEHGPPTTPSLSVRPRGLSRVGSLVAAAHAQDFERRKRPGQLTVASVTHGPTSADDSTDEEEEDQVNSRQDTDTDEAATEGSSPRAESQRLPN
ncbi:SPX and EXS domain-containing protein [Aspergillus clavatus NRRL 1]|uniref:Signal transduction protein Syg1, putative n=1 Tax=Aspergillus clavatus (strain ATCC 1007 / CBS 513.65 / DSM 816 / NCTC 3887 / NRRL 1 / QM 1276 / 107) TaxID=344612 RepID=A1CAD0_ASPCL|nr:signal transduction protein Syg1, putative [Aspergillus clavatus NRRL 1]EAW12698.1 signal transduction protein Syg1, putative [Aspergillus clavatus NRRL 1]